jgi:hypothetical protein
MKTKYLTFSEQIILESIDLDGYDVSANTDLEKINEVYEIFKSEYGYMIERIGERKAFEEWLQGLPSALSVPFYNYRILELAYERKAITTYKNERMTEHTENNFLNHYWTRLAHAFFTLKENL